MASHHSDARYQCYGKCTLNCSKVDVLGHADDFVLVMPTAQTLNFLLDALTSTLYILPLQIVVQISCNSCKKLDYEQPAAEASKRNYLGVLLKIIYYSFDCDENLPTHGKSKIKWGNGHELFFPFSS